MNTLSYGLLSLLSNSADSGYDLMRKIQPFWPAKHSQIYPLLAQLESGGYVQHTLVVQSDKPDKKVYSITPIGKEALRSWLTEPACEPNTRDELVLKLYCMEQGELADIRRLLETRVAYSQDKLAWLQAKLEVYSLQQPPPPLGTLLLMKKAEYHFESDLSWSEWALRQLVERQNQEEPNPR
ncbi:PadR family transcriptional regulator [Paenibacillus sacheonensis]|uniref:PadR family transcriptional regulator n=1 Tax=Paenibacillus sacheonensis TaxID=742054 RepID=A0A7X5BZG6_9BACL|nr:PadR family transcriptional regulator [Paenibacillus sacheonensis]MBM7567807.1 DNA-binding PadR family transcriptional regulator [Paenibacillus sacheonensis]NBC70697.1 PadR family transcriptional regulator [Paenibacillus sacheonensis]